RHGSNFSAAISPETTSIQVRLITPSANSATISAQQYPRAPGAMPGAHSKRAAQPVSPRAEDKSQRRAAFPQAFGLERGHVVQCCGEQRTDRDGSAETIPREDPPGLARLKR